MSFFSIFAGVPRAARWMAGSLAAIAIAAASIPVQAAQATLNGVATNTCTYTAVSVDANGNLTVTCNNAPANGQIAFSQTTYSADINNASFQVQVNRNSGTAGAVGATVSVNGGCSIGGGASTTVAFADGSAAAQAVTVATPATPTACVLSLSAATGGATLGANATINVIDPTAPGAFQFEAASSSANINVTNHIVRIVRTGGSNGTYDVLWGFTVAGLTGVAAAPNPVRFNSGETAKDITITSGTTAGTFGMTLVGANNVNPALQNGPYPVAPTVVNASVGTITAHTVTVAASSSCPTPGANVTAVNTPSPNTGTPIFGQSTGKIVSIPMPLNANNTYRLRVFNTSQTDASLTTTFALAKCPGDVQDSWATSGLAPCKKQGGYTGNSMDLRADQPLPVGGITFWGGKCGWLTADRASQWYFNIRVDNCNSGNCQFMYQIDANGAGY